MVSVREPGKDRFAAISLHQASVEGGIKRSILEAKPRDQVQVPASIGLSTGKKERNGVVFEITPETAEDAMGGWWVSVYDAKGVEQARASQEELDRITATREELEKQMEVAKSEERRKREEAAAKKKAAAVPVPDAPPAEPPPPKPADYTGTDDEWLAAWYLWRGYNPQSWRRPLAKPVPLPVKPRYYFPGYSRPGGRYQGGARLGGIRR